jgi:hypothetical protein
MHPPLADYNYAHLRAASTTHAGDSGIDAKRIKFLRRAAST